MAIKPGQSSQLDEIFGLEGRLGNSPFEAKRVGFGLGFMVKVFFVFLYKKKRYRYEDELGSKKIQPFPGNVARNACWYFLTHIEIIRKHTELPL